MSDGKKALEDAGVPLNEWQNVEGHKVRPLGAETYAKTLVQLRELLAKELDSTSKSIEELQIKAARLKNGGGA
jgi:hypothetical protein